MKPGNVQLGANLKAHNQLDAETPPNMVQVAPKAADHWNGSAFIPLSAPPAPATAGEQNAGTDNDGDEDEG